MKLKITSVLLLILLNISAVFSQKIKTDMLNIYVNEHSDEPKGSFSFENKFKTGDDKWCIVSRDNQNPVIGWGKGKGFGEFLFTEINSKGDVLNMKTLEVHEPKDAFFEKIEKVGDKIYIFSTTKTKGTYKLNAQEVDLVNQTISNEQKEIFSCDHSPQIHTSFSVDSSEVLLYFDQLSNTIGAYPKEVFSYILLDGDLNILDKGSEVTLPYRINDLTAMNFYVVKNEVKLIIGIGNGKGVSYITLKNGEFKETNLHIEGIAVINLFITVTKDQQLLVSGFYKNGASSTLYNGYYTAYLDENLNVKELKKYPFTAEFALYDQEGHFKSFLEEEAKDKGNTGIRDIACKQVISKSNGDLYLIGERGGTGGLSDVVVAYIGSDGNEKWIAKVKKLQPSYTFGWTSFKAFEYNNNIYLFYYDNLKNKDRKVGGVVESMNTLELAHLVCTRIDADGKMKKTYLASYKELPYTIKPKDIDEMQPGTYSIYSGGVIMQVNQ